MPTVHVNGWLLLYIASGTFLAAPPSTPVVLCTYIVAHSVAFAPVLGFSASYVPGLIIWQMLQAVV
jgi:hypothetical protein